MGPGASPTPRAPSARSVPGATSPPRQRGVMDAGASSGASTRACRGVRSASGRSGTSRTRASSSARSRRPAPTRSCCERPRAAFAARTGGRGSCSAGWLSWAARARRCPGPSTWLACIACRHRAQLRRGRCPPVRGESVRGGGPGAPLRAAIVGAATAGLDLGDRDGLELGLGIEPAGGRAQWAGAYAAPVVCRVPPRARRLRIAGLMWFSWRDAPAGCEWAPRSGLLGRGGGAKPALRAFRSAAR